MTNGYFIKLIVANHCSTKKSAATQGISSTTHFKHLLHVKSTNSVPLNSARNRYGLAQFSIGGPLITIKLDLERKENREISLP